MDTHWGKYQGPLAALLERWTLDGDEGDHSFSDPDGGEFTTMWNAPRSLWWEDGRTLMGEEFECSLEEIDALASEISHAQALVYQSDSQGFVYGWTLDSVADRDAQRKLLEDANDALGEE